MDIKISKNQQYCLNGMLGFTTGFLLNRSVAWISPTAAAYSSLVSLVPIAVILPLLFQERNHDRAGICPVARRTPGGGDIVGVVPAGGGVSFQWIAPSVGEVARTMRIGPDFPGIVTRARAERAVRALQAADALLVARDTKFAPFTYPLPCLRSKLFKDGPAERIANYRFQSSIRHIRKNCLAICMVGIMSSLVLCMALDLRSRIPRMVSEGRGRVRLMESLGRKYGINSNAALFHFEASAEFRKIYPSDWGQVNNVLIALFSPISLFIAAGCSLAFTYGTWGEW